MTAFAPITFSPTAFASWEVRAMRRLVVTPKASQAGRYALIAFVALMVGALVMGG